jgi:hypothetical protein
MPMMCTRLMPAPGDDWRLSDQDRFTMGDFIGKLKASKACTKGSLHD